MVHKTNISQTLEGLSQLSRIMRSEQWEGGAAFGLTPTQSNILSILCHRGPIRVSEIAKIMGNKQPTITDAIKAASDKGVMISKPDPADGRARLVEATSKGREVVEKLNQSVVLEGALDKLSEHDLASFKRALSQIILALQVSGDIVAQRHCLSCKFFAAFEHDKTDKPHHCKYVDQAFGDIELRLECLEHESTDLIYVLNNIKAFQNQERR